MESGDGLLVRVQAGARALPAGALRALCLLADAHGNGLIEITRRAKLQLRGVRAEGLGELQRELVALGLASESEEIERRTALVVDPLAGLDARSAPLDAVVADIEAALAGDASLRGLSSKFGVAVDASGVLRDIAADIRVEVRGEFAELYVPDVEGRWIAVGAVESGLASAVCALARLLAGSDHRRMRELVAAEGAATLAQAVTGAACRERENTKTGRREDGKFKFDQPSLQARADGLRQGAPTPQPLAVFPSSRLDIFSLGTSALPLTAADLLGLRCGLRSWVGAALPFGSGTSAQWRALAEVAEQLGDGSVRVTPFRGVILPDAQPAAAAQLSAAGWILDPADPLLRVVACPGAPACSSAAGETRGLARELARLMAAGARLHVSGCEKGCAHDGPADVTLVRTHDGVKLGFGLRAARAATLPSTPLPAALARLAQH
ncbi:MAG TPA: hypothetical protein VJR89_19965 [Polyangiales bacterium]|nr:hypothetical protein [Polyangiales bacterium]